MSLFFYDYPMKDSDDFDDFFESPFYSPYHYHNNRSRQQHRNKSNQASKVNAAKKQPSHIFDNDVYKLVDFCPKTNLGEDEKNYYIEVDLPGMSKEQINMELSEENVLIISGERVKNNTGMKTTKMDCQYGKFSRSFSLPETADLEKIQAKMENGVLEVIIPKSEPPKNQRRTIQIQ